jgi:hypothetical protein
MSNISFASIRLTRTKSEIAVTLSVLGSCGFTWKNNGQYYPQRNEANKFAFYLYDLRKTEPTVEVLQNGEPQPRPGDMVLGGKNNQSNEY